MVTYADGSTECAIVDSTTSSLGAVPVAGSQKAGGNNGGTTGGGNGGSAPIGGTGGGGTGGGGGGGEGGIVCYDTYVNGTYVSTTCYKP